MKYNYTYIYLQLLSINIKYISISVLDSAAVKNKLIEEESSLQSFICNFVKHNFHIFISENISLKLTLNWLQNPETIINRHPFYKYDIFSSLPYTSTIPSGNAIYYEIYDAQIPRDWGKRLEK